MITLHYPETPKEKQLVAATGFFDGLHIGHQTILRNIVNEAKQKNKKSCLVTFWPHPRIVLGKDAESLRMLTTIDEKIALVAKLGIDYFYLIPFTQNFAQLTAEQFFNNILIEKLNISELYIGYNHRFGHNANAGFDEISKIGNAHNISVHKIEAVADGNLKISSTSIRNLLALGNVAEANRMLGYQYKIGGPVVHGNRIGSTMLGFPTANIQPHAYKMIPKNGVYAVYVCVKNKMYNGMLNIGLRPTFNNTERPIIEVNIFDFDEDIYDLNIEVSFVEHIRDERHFGSPQELKQQLLCDKKNIEQLLSTN